MPQSRSTTHLKDTQEMPQSQNTTHPKAQNMLEAQLSQRPKICKVHVFLFFLRYSNVLNKITKWNTWQVTLYVYVDTALLELCIVLDNPILLLINP